jgi:hypothetical protein
MNIATLREIAERHALATRLIGIGYKELAAELHPDKGGSHDGMARASKVRDRLRKLIDNDPAALMPRRWNGSQDPKARLRSVKRRLRELAGNPYVYGSWP